MPKKNEKLKPCPFCGELPDLNKKFIQGYGGYTWDIMCLNHSCPIDVWGYSFSRKELAIKAWNTRI